MSGGIINIQILIEHSESVIKQETLIRRHVLWRLIWVCDVCLCPQKDARLIRINIAFKCIFMNALYYMGHDTRITVFGVLFVCLI